MAELNEGINYFKIDTSGDTGKQAFTSSAPTGGAEGTHWIAKSSGDMGVFLYTNNASPVICWQKIGDSWTNCGSLVQAAPGEVTTKNFPWRDGAEYMHFQLDGTATGSEEVRVHKIEGNMFAKFSTDAADTDQILLLNDARVDDVDSDGDLEVTSGDGYIMNRVDVSGLSEGQVMSFNVEEEINLGFMFKNDVELVDFSSVWDGAKSNVQFTMGVVEPGDTYKFFYSEAVSSSWSGNASDGPISGATVTDVASGATTTTDANGDFTFASKPTGEIRVEGGTDAVTGLAYEGILKGNADYTVISPLTTLATESVAENGGTYDNAINTILDNSEYLFGIAFPREDRLEILNKRFVSEAANGNTKALRGSALMSMIDSAAELHGEALRNTGNADGKAIANDASDGKERSYRGMARLVSSVNAQADSVKESFLDAPVALDTDQVAREAAKSKDGVEEVTLTELNGRGSGYRGGIRNALRVRREHYRAALAPSFDENYAAGRIQAIARTTKNEDKVEVEGFLGTSDLDVITTIDAHSAIESLNQIGDTANKTVLENKYDVQHIGSLTQIQITFQYGEISAVNSNIGSNFGMATLSYFKELERGSQLFVYNGASEYAVDLRTALGTDSKFGQIWVVEGMSRAKTGSFTFEGFTYTFDYEGLIIAKEAVKEEPKEKQTIHPLAGYNYYTLTAAADEKTELGFATSLANGSSWDAAKDGSNGFTRPAAKGEEEGATLTFDAKSGNWVDSVSGTSVGDFAEGGEGILWLREPFSSTDIYKMNSEEGVVWYAISDALSTSLDEALEAGEEPGGEEPGAGDTIKSDHPLEGYYYLYDVNKVINEEISSFSTFKFGGGVYMSDNGKGDFISTTDIKGGYYKLNKGASWSVVYVDPMLGEGMTMQSSALDFAVVEYVEAGPETGEISRIILTAPDTGKYLTEDQYVYAVSATWYDSLTEEPGGEEPGGEEPGGEEPENHIKSTGSYELSSPSVKASLDGAVTAGKRGNELTFNDGITHFVVQPTEEVGTFNITQTNPLTGLAAFVASGVSFAATVEGTETLSFTIASAKEGGEDISWTITYTPAPSENPGGEEPKGEEPGGEEPVAIEHLVNGGTYTHQQQIGEMVSGTVTAIAGEGELLINYWLIKASTIKGSPGFQAQQGVTSKETEEITYGDPIAIGEFNFGQISWEVTTEGKAGSTTTKHTVTYQEPKEGK